MIVDVDSLKTISFKSQLAFAYLSCERLFDHYIYFSRNFSFGDSRILYRAIRHMREYITTNILPNGAIELDFSDVYDNTPDSDDFGSEYCTYAQNACFVILNSLKFLQTRNFIHLSYISQYPMDSIDTYVASGLNVDTVSQELQLAILHHPLMEKEISIQNEIIFYLNIHKEIAKDDIDFLLKLQGKLEIL